MMIVGHDALHKKNATTILLLYYTLGRKRRRSIFDDGRTENRTEYFLRKEAGMDEQREYTHRAYTHIDFNRE
jgi:hypothetical protein